MRIGADTGGTFTDVVDDQGRVHKVPSTPSAPDRAVAAGVAVFAVGTRPEVLAHGTTVATNAVLEGELAPTALFTTAGLRDVIEIGRQDRPSLYDQFASRPPPLVPRTWRLEVAGRLAGDGAELEAVDLSGLPDVPDGAVAVAVCLLHADLDPAHELAVAAELRRRHPGLEIVCSHEVSPEYREFERTVTTVVDAGLLPRCGSYLDRLGGLADHVLVMTSSGGLLDAGAAAGLPASLLLSGPAAGVGAAAAVATANGFADAVTFDMGGTSTDVCLVRGGRPSDAGLRHVGGYPVRFPALDIHTIGAGGGSIARVDRGGALVVGPTSAGAEPGPAAYGRGGTAATVTDADLVAGRIPAGATFGGLRLDRDAAVAALDRAGVDAVGVIRVVDANMERAVRAVSVERGVDPRSLALVAFGGAGGLHACALAEALDMAAVIVPARAGVLSAVGLLTAPVRRDLVHSWPAPLDHAGAVRAATALGEQARHLLGGSESAGAVTVEVSFDCRYAGQSHELMVPSIEAFHREHEERNGFARPEAPVEVVAVRARATGAPPLGAGDLTVPASRAGAGPVDGPAVIAEPDCTVWVADGWRAEIGAAGAWVLRRRT